MAAPKGFGMVAYWGELSSTYSGQVPKGSLVVINPNSGATGLSAEQVANWKEVIAEIRAQGGKVLGYVATGYDGSTADELARYNDISAQLGAYKSTLGGVDGFFFDEAAFDDGALTDAQKCASTPTKWSAIRATMGAAGVSGTVVWNAGWPGANACFVGSASYGEHVVTYEAAYQDYNAAASWLNVAVRDVAATKGVTTWLLVHSATKAQMKKVLTGSAADYVYVTSMSYNPSLPYGGPIWNYTPTYWGKESLTGSERWCLKRLKADRTC